ncbi:SRPBCC family protein [Falsiroseomonas sp. HW251]|uniref:SRPBCC family protein n=1 Tax=Falsiroseomonas sp. HW251 TaxID=3390998 RepID=UPI003D31B1F7
MADHSARIAVFRPAQDVYEFLADPMNLPRWQPSLREAFREAPDRIRAIGGGLGAQGVAAHMRFVAAAEDRSLSWATATGVGCAGDIRVHETPDGAEVELNLRLAARADRPDALARWTGDAALDVAAALRSSLEAIRLVFDGVTSEVEPVSGGMQADPREAPLRDSRAFGMSATQNPDEIARPETDYPEGTSPEDTPEEEFPARR